MRHWHPCEYDTAWESHTHRPVNVAHNGWYNEGGSGRGIEEEGTGRHVIAWGWAQPLSKMHLTNENANGAAVWCRDRYSELHIVEDNVLVAYRAPPLRCSPSPQAHCCRLARLVSFRAKIRGRCHTTRPAGQDTVNVYNLRRGGSVRWAPAVAERQRAGGPHLNGDAEFRPLRCARARHLSRSRLLLRHLPI